MNSENGSLRPQFTRRIDLGHILTAVVFILTISGGMVGTYISIQSRLNEQANVAANQQQQIIDLGKRLQQVQDDQRASSRDIALSLSRLSEQLVDLRILVAGKDGTHK